MSMTTPNAQSLEGLTDERLAEWLDEVGYHFDRAETALPVGLAHPSSMARRLRQRISSRTSPEPAEWQVEAIARVMFATDWPKDDWDRFKPGDVATNRYLAMSRAALRAASIPTPGGEVTDALDYSAFAGWLRPWVKKRFGQWITHNTTKGAYQALLAALKAGE